MTLPYGYAKAKVLSDPTLTSKPRRNEIQYHLHLRLQVGDAQWDAAVNVGTNDADDLLKYKLVYDFRHPVIRTLGAAKAGATDLTGTNALPALDFQRSDILAATGKWRDSDVMDGSERTEPAASLVRLLTKAKNEGLDVYLFGRFYSEGNGLHDIHMNQGSKGEFVHRPGNDRNDHNDIWQDGAVLVDLGGGQWAVYFSAFEQQWLPTDPLGNATADARPIGG